MDSSSFPLSSTTRKDPTFINSKKLPKTLDVKMNILQLGKAITLELPPNILLLDLVIFLKQNKIIDEDNLVYFRKQEFNHVHTVKTTGEIDTSIGDIFKQKCMRKIELMVILKKPKTLNGNDQRRINCCEIY